MKKLFLLLSSLALCRVSLNAAVPSFSDFNTNQFGLTGNKVSVKSGASITNPIITGMFIGNNGLADAGVTNRPNITFDGDTWNFFQDGMPAAFDGALGAQVFNGGGWQLSDIPGSAITNAVTNAVYATTAGSAATATTAGTATNLVAPAIITWSGPTNTLALGYPWSKTTYVMTGDISVTNFTGITTGVPCECVFVLTNSASSNCAVRMSAAAIGYGTLITNSTAYVLAGKKAVVSVLSGSATNWAIVQQSQ